MIITIFTGEKALSIFLVEQIKTFCMCGALFGNLPLWFLPILFLCRCASNELIKHTSKVVLICLFLFILGCAINYLQENITKYIPFYVGASISGLFFFICGYLLKCFQYRKAVFLVAGVCYFLFVSFGIPQVDMRTNLTLSGLYPLWMPFCLSGIILFNNIVKLIPDCVINSEYNVLTHVGRDSMTFYVAHWPLVLLLKYVFLDLIGFNLKLSYTFTLIFTAVILYTCRNIKLYIYGKSNYNRC